MRILRTKATALAFRLARRFGRQRWIARFFVIVEPILPLKRVARTADFVAFHHPRPISKMHILIVPRFAVPYLGMADMDAGEQVALLHSLFAFAKNVSMDLQPERAWELIVNGGTRQEIRQIHGHLILHPGDESESDAPDLGAFIQSIAGQPPDSIPPYSIIARWNSAQRQEISVTID